MGHYFLLIFCTIVDNWNIEKFAELFFSRKIHFCPNFDKKGLKRTRNSFFWIFLKMLSLLLFGSNLNWELMLLLMFHYQFNIWQNSGSLVMSQNALGQSNKNLSVLQVNTIILGVTRHAQNTQNKNFVYLHYLQKSKRDVVDFSPADKHEVSLQFNSNTLGVRSQACPKYPSKFTIFLQYLRENVKDEVDFLPQIDVKGFFELILSF